MEKRAQQENKERLFAEERQRPGVAGSKAAAASALALRALAAGVPVDLLPPQAALELAKQIGNSAFLSLLRPGREVLTVAPPELTDCGLPPHPIKAQPPALAQPLGLGNSMDFLPPFELEAGMWGAGTGGSPFITAPDMGGTHA